MTTSTSTTTIKESWEERNLNLKLLEISSSRFLLHFVLKQHQQQMLENDVSRVPIISKSNGNIIVFERSQKVLRAKSERILCHKVLLPSNQSKSTIEKRKFEANIRTHTHTLRAFGMSYNVVNALIRSNMAIKMNNQEHLLLYCDVKFNESSNLISIWMKVFFIFLLIFCIFFQVKSFHRRESPVKYNSTLFIIMKFQYLFIYWCMIGSSSHINYHAAS